jgi:hypothetical protein
LELVLVRSGAIGDRIAPCFVELCEAVVAVNDVKRPSEFGQERDCLCPFRSELSPKVGDGRGRSGGGGCGLTVGRLRDDLDPVVECHTENEFWQLVMSVETTPAFLCALDQFEDHRERGPVGQTALRSDRAVPHGGEGAFDGVGRPQVFPVLGREVVESEQRVSILARAVGRLLVFQRVALDEGAASFAGLAPTGTI